MEFDKSRVYTSLNADELRAGDKVIVANCISMIKAILVEGIQKNIKEINEILGEGYSERFHVGNNDYALAYLVERKENCTNCGCVHCWYREKHGIDEQRLHTCSRRIEPRAEKHYRPFVNTDELVKVWNAKIGIPKSLQTDGALTMPYIWVQRKDKSTGASQHLITSLNIPILRNEQWTNGVSVESTSITFEALFRLYEFLDGSPCGVEE